MILAAPLIDYGTVHLYLRKWHYNPDYLMEPWPHGLEAVTYPHAELVFPPDIPAEIQLESLGEALYVAFCLFQGSRGKLWEKQMEGLYHFLKGAFFKRWAEAPPTFWPLGTKDEGPRRSRDRTDEMWTLKAHQAEVEAFLAELWAREKSKFRWRDIWQWEWWFGKMIMRPAKIQEER